MGRGRLGPIFGEGDRLDRHEVLHEQVAFVVLAQRAETVLNSQLNGLHEMVGLDLFVGHLTRVVHSAVADFALFLGGRVGGGAHRGRGGAAATIIIDGLGGARLGVRLGECPA